jgi:hypothetical protein
MTVDGSVSATGDVGAMSGIRVGYCLLLCIVPSMVAVVGEGRDGVVVAGFRSRLSGRLVIVQSLGSADGATVDWSGIGNQKGSGLVHG